MEPERKRLRLDALDATSSPLPSKPCQFITVSEGERIKFESDVAQVLSFLESENQSKEVLSTPARKAKSESDKVIRSILSGGLYSVEECNRSLNALLEILEGKPSWMRGMNHIRAAITGYITASCLIGFFETGKLKNRNLFAKLTTTEYLLGVIQFAEELEAYAIGRAMWQDAASIVLCRNMSQAILDVFVEFNFRNGLLRRRFDGLKYRVKKLESLLYELSLVQVHEAAPTSSLLDVDQFKGLANEVDRETESRDVVIKASRDPQKDSKKAIYALHRGNYQEARDLLKKSLDILLKTADETILKIGELHEGAYGNALEEYAEGRIFEEWLLQPGHIVSYETMRVEARMNEKEYLGGLVDFTGELGRLGIAKATTRDIEAVKGILSTMIIIRDVALQINNFQIGNLNKKLEAVFTNTRKMENTMYELILVTSTNRRSIELSST